MIVIGVDTHKRSHTLVALDATIIATASSTIARELGRFDQLPWLLSTYLLAQAVSTPVYGRLADIVGRKRLMLVGIGLFFVGSAIAGAAPSMLVLIVGRAVQGLGAGAVMPVSMTITSDIYTLEERAKQPADPINPQRVFWELSSRLPDYAILSSDSGSAANWFARDLKLREGMMASLSGTLATMGCAVPYAVGAKFAHPDRTVVAAVGDGAMQMTGINALIDVAGFTLLARLADELDEAAMRRQKLERKEWEDDRS